MIFHFGFTTILHCFNDDDRHWISAFFLVRVHCHSSKYAPWSLRFLFLKSLWDFYFFKILQTSFYHSWFEGPVFSSIHTCAPVASRITDQQGALWLSFLNVKGWHWLACTGRNSRLEWQSLRATLWPDCLVDIPGLRKYLSLTGSFSNPLTWTRTTSSDFTREDSRGKSSASIQIWSSFSIRYKALLPKRIVLLLHRSARWCRTREKEMWSVNLFSSVGRVEVAWSLVMQRGSVFFSDALRNDSYLCSFNSSNAKGQRYSRWRVTMARYKFHRVPDLERCADQFP